jgi:hypothetical protein
MVAGEICGHPPGAEAGAGLAEVEGLLEISNGFVALKPVDCEEDEFDDVSDLRASSADDAAPRASNMERTPTDAACRGSNFPRRWISKRRAIAKKPIK